MYPLDFSDTPNDAASLGHCPICKGDIYAPECGSEPDYVECQICFILVCKNCLEEHIESKHTEPLI